MSEISEDQRLGTHLNTRDLNCAAQKALITEKKTKLGVDETHQS